MSNFAIYPNTRLSRLVRAQTEGEIMALCDGHDVREDAKGDVASEFFFNRAWTTFNSILDFYRLGSLHLPIETCAMVFKDDLAFWGIDELYLDPCCALKYYPEIEACHKEFKSERLAKKQEEDRQKYENFGESTVGRVRGTLWKMTEYPESSRKAQVPISR